MGIFFLCVACMCLCISVEVTLLCHALKVLTNIDDCYRHQLIVIKFSWILEAKAMRKCLLPSIWRNFKITINLSKVAFAFLGFGDTALPLFLHQLINISVFFQSPNSPSKNMFSEVHTEFFNGTLRPVLCIVTFTFE